MSNKNIIHRMLEILTKYENGDFTPTEVEESMEFHCQALEKIGLKEIDKIRDLSYQLVTSHMLDDEDEYIDSIKAEQVVKNFKSFISTLPSD